MKGLDRFRRAMRRHEERARAFGLHGDADAIRKVRLAAASGEEAIDTDGTVIDLAASAEHYRRAPEADCMPHDMAARLAWVCTRAAEAVARFREENAR